MIRSVACIAARRRDRRRRASAHPRRRTDTAVVCRATGLPAHVQISVCLLLLFYHAQRRQDHSAQRIAQDHGPDEPERLQVHHTRDREIIHIRHTVLETAENKHRDAE